VVAVVAPIAVALLTRPHVVPVAKVDQNQKVRLEGGLLDTIGTTKTTP
jgi:hypothetical protein